MSVASRKGLDNSNPLVYESVSQRELTEAEQNDDVVDKFDGREVFDMIRRINDPEHPLTLEELNVVQIDHCEVDDDKNRVVVYYTPTIPHCSMATLIGLAIRVKLLRSLPERFKVDVRIYEGSHVSEAAVNKQLSDKERVAAALENDHLLNVINQCLTIHKK
ncbi:hypothetical protein RvY_15932 [Ramazzottius varieornatus]|uniref:MIP18 family-like domain-containing protein n=1 Tax=Ramazzottius varieornatus TaxID=947166 RepID=A0A1D1W182_RAMVA|nr:hypothetical protein RvY_15932 [Ramazzottius varieornatus]